ncbi:unnamed protein product [Cutaneotrichosporon oleaginosum]
MADNMRSSKPLRRSGMKRDMERNGKPHTKHPEGAGKADTKPKASRASPPPKDDFDLDAAEDANGYKEEQMYLMEREKVRKANKARKAQGEKPLKMPVKPKREIVHPRKRQNLDDSDDSDGTPGVDSGGRELQYEGQRILPFDPLVELASLPPGTEPDEITLKQRALEPRAPPPRKTRVDDAPPGALGNGLLSWLKSESGTTSSVKPEAGIKHDIRPHIADVKPNISRNVKPHVSADVKPVVSHHDVKLQISPEIKPSRPSDFDIKPSAAALQAADLNAQLSGDEQQSSEVGEDEEDYSEDVIIAPWGSNRPLPAANEAPGEEEEEEVYTEDETEEVYSDDEGSSTPSSQSQEHSLVPIGSKVIAVKERPAFPCTEQQLNIGPHNIDSDDSSMVIPSSINRFLRNYQRDGVEFFYSKYKRGYGGILGDDMGLGKTVQVIAFLSAIMRKTGTAEDKGRRKHLIRSTNVQSIAAKRWPTALIVCPTSLVDNWSRELDTWGFFEYKVLRSSSDRGDIETMRLGYLDILLTSYEMCIKFADELKTAPFSTVFVDEAHRLKKPTGLLTLAVKKLRAGTCFALTGTLIQNRMEEMWSVLDFVHRGWAGTFKQWKTFAARPVTRGHRRDGTLFEVVQAIKRVGELKDKVLPHFYIRRDKGLIAHELPKKHDKVVLCPLAKNQEAVYKRVVDSADMMFILGSKNPCDCGSGRMRMACCAEVNSQGDDYRTAVLKMFHALGRCANHLALLYSSPNDPPKVKATAKRLFEFCVGLTYDPNRHNQIEAALDPDNCGKWLLLVQMLREWRLRPEEKNKILVFSNSVRLLNMIHEFINTTPSLSGFGCELFIGEVDKADRMGIVDRFQDPDGDLSIMLVSTMAGGVGLNLTAANKVVIFDPNWNPANDLQAMDRAFRIGQTRPVDVYRLIGQGTVEELMYERQIYKQQRSRQMNKGTFERRTHAGYEGATDMSDKGELFGVHNLFRYWPGGYVKNNLERVRQDEDRFRLDLIEAEYENDSGDEEDGVTAARRERDKRKASQAAEQEEASLLTELISDGTGPSSEGEDLLTKLGISTMEHDKAFRDSPEERALYEMGLEILKHQPHLASTLANDVARLTAATRPAKKARRSEDSKELKREQVEEPWKDRFAAGRVRNRGKQLVDSDEE